jgi:mono/diheme cytochrome c family protein/uncharacterized membrane protein
MNHYKYLLNARPHLQGTLRQWPGWYRGSSCMVLVVLGHLHASAQDLAGEAAATGEAADSFWLWQLLGRLHPLVVHFPVSLLCVALLLEGLAWQRKSAALRPGIHALVLLGALSAVPAALFGWLLSGEGEYGGPMLDQHLWAGVATTVLALAAAAALVYGRRVLYRSLLGLSVVGVVAAGHLGASLTHGESYLTEVLPGGAESTPAGPAAGVAYSLASTSQPLTNEQIETLNLEVRTILAHNCYSCHGEAKTKGGLRLDKKEFVMEGGKSGAVIVPGQPEKSELYRRVTLPATHKKVMPSKGKHLSDKEIAVLGHWIKQGAPWPEGPEKSIYRLAPLALRTPELPAASAGLTNPVDRLVNGYFKQQGINWGASVPDRLYIRRVYLDALGLLPLPAEVEAFVNDPRPEKRELLVSTLLNRHDDYAQHWLTFWNDALRNDYSGTGYITGGRSDITKWLYSSLRSNKPYNWFVKELISPTKESEGFVKGIKWRGTINASQRTEMQAAQNVAQVFLGLNLKCASCHDSFISDWKLEDAYAFANIFADSTLEINRCDKPTGKMAPTRILFPELGTIDATAPTPERLRQLAEYLTEPKDGRLYRTLVNRIWAQLMGRGIIEPVDMMDNVPWSEDLLDWLAADFVANGYDVRRLIQTILTSRTYQLASVAVNDPAVLVAQDFQFRGMIRRRLTAEQFADAVSVAIHPVYADSALSIKRLPENITKYLPFPRAGLVKNDGFLTALGRPNRETVSTSRVSQASLLQALELTNGTRFNETLRQGARKWRSVYKTSDQLIRELYRTALGREALEGEVAAARRLLGQVPTEESMADLAWAIALHPEFQLIF